MNEFDRIVVVGAGAIGAPIGALLHEQGQAVVLVARGKHGEALRSRGLDLRTPRGAHQIHPPVVPDVESAKVTRDDLVFLTAMGHQTEAALLNIPHDVTVVSLQNGVTPLDQIAKRGHPTIAGMVYVPAERRADGVIALSGSPNPGTILLGAWSGQPSGVTFACSALAGIGFRAEQEADIRPWIRAKLLANLGGILVALCDDLPEDIYEDALGEARNVWTAAGHAYQELDALQARVGALETVPVDDVPRVGGSTRHALRRGDPLETASLHGHIVALGAKMKIPTPVNAALIAIADRAHVESRAPGSMSADALRHAVEIESLR